MNWAAPSGTASSVRNSLENSGFIDRLFRTSQHAAHSAQGMEMSTFRNAAFSVMLPFALLLQGCHGDEPGSRQAIDVSQHLARIPGQWIDQSAKRTEVKI